MEHSESSRVTGWAGTTHWTVVVKAGQGKSPQAAAALEQLCRTYWFPLYAYVRRRGYHVPEAQDLTQEFFARMLEHHWLARASPTKGKFRCFLLTAMNHFLANEWHRAHAAKRGGARAFLSLDAAAETRYAQSVASELTPEKIYERNWALNLFDRALGRLREEYARAGKRRLYEQLKGFLAYEPEAGDYNRIGLLFGMSVGAVATAVHRLRQHYRELVREEIAQTVASPEEIEDERRSLLAALS